MTQKLINVLKVILIVAPILGFFIMIGPEGVQSLGNQAMFYELMTVR